MDRDIIPRYDLTLEDGSIIKDIHIAKHNMIRDNGNIILPRIIEYFNEEMIDSIKNTKTTVYLANGYIQGSLCSIHVIKEFKLIGYTDFSTR